MPEKIKGQFKSYPIEFKEINDEKRIIEGYASTKDIDRVDDIVEPSAFNKAVKKFIKSNGILLFNHKYDYAIGKIISAKIDDKGLYVKAEIAKDVEKADEVWSLIKQGVLKTFSFGFIPINKEYKEENGKTIRILKEVDLLEISIVSVPANPNATFIISEGKAIGIEFETKKASGDTTLPLADMSRSWDKNRAVSSVRKWASSDGSGEKDKINWSKYRKAFFWYDETDPENFSSYKLPFAEVIDGKLYAVPRGVMAAAAAIQGARGGVNIPEKDMQSIKTKIAKYYEKMGKEPPWKKGYFDIDEIKFFIDSYVIIPDFVTKEEIQETKTIIEELKSELDSVKNEITELKTMLDEFKINKECKQDNKLDEDYFYTQLQNELKNILDKLTS